MTQQRVTLIIGANSGIGQAISTELRNNEINIVHETYRTKSKQDLDCNNESYICDLSVEKGLICFAKNTARRIHGII